MAMNPRLLRPLASGFSPRQIPGLAFWLDAADSATVTTVSGAVSEWRSKAGNGLAATQATAANRPAYTASGRNGKNVVTFDGAESSSGDSLVTSAISLAQPYTVFWAGRSNGRLPGVTPADAPYIFDGSTSGTRVAMVYNGSNVAASNGRLGIFAGTAVVEPTSGTQAYNEWGIVSAVFSGAASSLRSNSAEVATGSPGTNAMVALRLGTRYDEAATSTATFFEGPWGEFLIYNSILTASQRQKVEGYLAWKWGLQSQLPYDHPYANGFPGFGDMPLDVNYLVVAGGGGGGTTRGGGGGAGGVLQGTEFAPTAGSNYTVTVGAGGAGGTANAGVAGSNSVFSSNTASGGGAGGSFAVNGGAGGSGGGGGASTTSRPGGTATAGQGNKGGDNNTSFAFSAGGGGGAGAAGANVTVSQATDGGIGILSSITGTPTYYAGGGGGSGGDGSTTFAGAGGLGGGGAGSDYSQQTGTATPGTANTGGGGGGAAQPGGYSVPGGSGGSGVVILRYPRRYTMTVGAGLTYTTTDSGPWRIARFTAGTGNVSWA